MQFAIDSNVRKYLRYAIGEIIIVLIGVLLAFMLNSWWIYEKESQTKKVILSNLMDEMKYNNQELQQTLTIDEFVLRNANALEGLLKLSKPGESVVVPDTILGAFIIAATNNPSTGSLNSILSSGKIDYLTDNELITSIITWNNKLDDATEDEKTAFEFIENQFLPGLRDETDLSYLLNNLDDLVLYAKTGAKKYLNAEFSSAAVKLRYSNSLINLIVQRKMRLRIIIRGLKKLQEHQDKMLDLIKNGHE